MASAERFRDRSQVRQELQRLDTARQASAQRLERHWQALQDREVRGRLISDAVGDVLYAWKPLRMASALFSGGSFTSALGTAFGRGRGWSGRLFWFVGSLILPTLLERAKDLRVEDLAHHLRISADHISAYFARRKEERTRQE